MFRFYSKADETGGIRVAIVGQHVDGKLRLAASRCSSKDNFSKKTGRAIAEGRLNKGKIYKELEISAENCNIETFVSVAKNDAVSIANDPRILNNI